MPSSSSPDNDGASPEETGHDAKSSVVVVGSLNVDTVAPVRSIPVPGETVMGGRLQTFPGGKGLNQAIAAAHAGANVAMIGQIGDDDGGHLLRQSLERAGVDHSAVATDPDELSGSAFITVDERGENAIVVSPGANNSIGPDHVRQVADIIAGARVVLLQLEIPLAAIEAAIQTATGLVILNPAPAPVAGETLPPELLERVDILIPNRTELAAVAHSAAPGFVPTTVADVEAMIAEVSGPGQVIVTLGADGVISTEGDGPKHLPAPTVTAVDTTGAGDCFCGSLAGRLAQDDSIQSAIHYAMAAAALSVTKPGASDSMPSAEQVASLLAFPAQPD